MKYRVTVEEGITLNGKKVAKGEVVELSTAQAEQLAPKVEEA